MPRVTNLFQNQYVFHVTGKVQNSCWQDWENCLQRANKEKLTVHAFVLMSTHFHLLYSVILERDLRYGFVGENYLITNFEQYKNSYRYIYRNPLEAGLCQRAEYYPFSTLPVVLGKKTSKIQVVDHMGLIVNPHKILEWINTDAKVHSKYLRFE